jgi:hypothetical protein
LEIQSANGLELHRFAFALRMPRFFPWLDYFGGSPMNPKTVRSRSVARIAEVSALASLFLVAVALADNPVPQVVGPVKPQAVVPGSAEFTLTVYGANFVSGAVVNWNGQPRSTTFISTRELQAQMLASDVAKPTAGYITVTNPPPGGGKSSSSYAIVEVHQPTKTIAVSTPNVLPSDSFYTIAVDVYGDGKLDLVAGEGSGQITVNRSNGDGTFQIATTIGHTYFPDAGLTFGDFNGDAKLDLIYGWGPNSDPPTYLKVLLAEGNGKFRGLPHFGLFSDSYPRGIVAGDFDGDGKLDVAVSHQGGSFGGGVFLGNGDGTFKHIQSFSEGGEAVGADFNGDGKLDVVVSAGGALFLFLGNGDGTFQKARRIAPALVGCAFGPSLLVNDFNGDGKADLAFCVQSKGNASRIGVALGNGDGTFQRPVYYSTSLGAGNAFSFTAGDFNSDGKTDFIASTPLGTIDTKSPASNFEFAVLWGNGDGTFRKAKKIVLPKNFGGEIGIVPGDFNSDGLMDFVLVGNGGHTVYIQK